MDFEQNIPQSENLSRTLACKVAYDGAPFAGFARQAECDRVMTVQGELEHALRVLYRRDVRTTCAGRTDAGVHAIGQVVSFDVTEDEFASRTPRSLLRSLNALVDDHMSVSVVEEKPFGFSARFDAKWREYRYRISTAAARPVLIMPLVWHLGGVDLDIDAMNRAAVHLIGEHDFKSFCVAASAVGKPTCRNVMELEVFEEEILGQQVATVRVVGNAFLHSMVRTIVGTLVEVGRGRRNPEWVCDVLEARNRGAAGQNAPAQGLVFWHVEYE
jgi:tRNA pseudouridine38-40 synthase